MKRFWLLAPLAVMMALSACAISPGPEVLADTMCHFKRYSLEVEIKDDPIKGVGESTFAAALRHNYDTLHFERAATGVSPSLLILSGGSQNGAYGAGFLDQWARESANGLPRFKVVTGVSTGAILSTFAFIRQPEIGAQAYTLLRENQVLNPIVHGGGKLSLLDGVKIARRGAEGELSPLRDKLRGLITAPVLEQIGREQAEGRALYVGAVDADSGQAVIFDMTDMAARYSRAADNYVHVRDCYVDAIVASSSVPLAAPPAFIDNRMYIDGGARFGVFSDEIGGVIDERTRLLESEFGQLMQLESFKLRHDTPAPPNVFVLVNGSLTVDPRCGKEGGTCPGGNGALAGRHAKWDLLSLAQRSVSILINQTYRFSTAEVLGGQNHAGFRYQITRIMPDLAGFAFTMDEPALDTGTKKCLEWQNRDAEVDNPVEFHPRYMRCLIAYGRHAATASHWAQLQ